MSEMWNEPFVSERLIPKGPIPLIPGPERMCSEAKQHMLGHKPPVAGHCPVGTLMPTRAWDRACCAVGVKRGWDDD